MNVLKTCNKLKDSAGLFRIISLASISFLFFFSKSIAAANRIAESTEPLVSGRIINVSIGLLFVLFMFFVLAFLLKRIPSFQTTQNGCLNIIDTLHLGANERILLIQVGQKQILVGANAQKIETLHVLSEIIEINPAEQKKPFKEQLLKMLATKTTKESLRP